MEKVFFNNLQRWRFFAALAVISSHYVTVFSERDPALNKFLRLVLTIDGSGAEMGVNFFFVLSGFLITWLLLQEKNETGRIMIGNFYMRRILRIWPLYLLSVFLGFILVPLIVGPSYNEVANWKWYVAFLANFDQIYHWKNITFPNPLLGVHWSIAVEEHFYLFWPWLILFTSKRFPVIASIIVVLSLAFGWISRLPTHTISCFHDLAIGGIAAYLCFWKKNKIELLFNSIDRRVIAVVFIMGTVLIAGRFQLSLHFSIYEYLYRTIHAVFFAFIIVEQCFNQRNILSWLPSKLFSYLGKISYGLYLLHPISLLIVLYYFPEPLAIFWFQFPAVIIFSILLSMLSFHSFESYFLRFKQAF